MKKIVVCFFMVLCLSSTAVACNKKIEAESEKKESKEIQKKDEKVNEKREYQIIGNRTEKAFDIFIKNNMGQDITGITVKASNKTEYPANMMKTGQILKGGEVAEFFYTPEDVVSTDNEMTEKAINVTYSVQITLADGSQIELSSLGFEDIKKDVELCLEDGVGFVEYISKSSGMTVSTKEQELGAKAQREAAAAQAAQETQAAQESQAMQEQNTFQQQETYTDNTYNEPVYSEPEYQQPEEQVPQEQQPQELPPEQNSEGCLNPDDVIINPQQ